MTFLSTKTYGHEVGLSAAFRQWRAISHCRVLHGYALSVKLTFAADYLDDQGWVVDFGALKSLKHRLESTFDHKVVVAADDPQLAWFNEGHRLGIIDMVVVPATGCEKFAELIFNDTEVWLKGNDYLPRVRLARVEICEHGANSAIYEGNPIQ